MKETARKPYTLLAAHSDFELTEKKSRFLAEAIPVTGEEEILAELERIRKLHYNARHHCYAYCYGERYENTRISDDGEPTGTAGKPIFDVLSGAQVTNCLIVVTRYFGGTLLGTGGLVRAYGGAAKGALDAAQFIQRLPAKLFKVEADYDQWGKLQYFLGQQELIPTEQEFGTGVTFNVTVRDERTDGFLKGITELSAGRIRPELIGDTWDEVSV